MTFYEIVLTIKDAASLQYFVNDVEEGDIYEYLNSTDHKYATVFLTIQSVTSDEDLDTLNCTLFYIDRLTDTQDNKLQIQSTAISTLKDILRKLREDNTSWTIDSNTFTPFRAKYKDVTAGAYASLSISYANDIKCDKINTPA